MDDFGWPASTGGSSSSWLNCSEGEIGRILSNISFYEPSWWTQAIHRHSFRTLHISHLFWDSFWARVPASTTLGTILFVSNDIESLKLMTTTLSAADSNQIFLSHFCTSSLLILFSLCSPDPQCICSLQSTNNLIHLRETHLIELQSLKALPLYYFVYSTTHCLAKFLSNTQEHFYPLTPYFYRGLNYTWQINAKGRSTRPQESSQAHWKWLDCYRDHLRILSSFPLFTWQPLHYFGAEADAQK